MDTDVDYFGEMIYLSAHILCLPQLHPFLIHSDSIRRTLAAVTVRQRCVAENDERMNQHMVWRPLGVTAVMMRGSDLSLSQHWTAWAKGSSLKGGAQSN